MKRYIFGFLLALLSISSGNAIDKDIVLDSTLPDYTHEGKQWPPVLFVSSVGNDDFKNFFASYGAFEHLDEEAFGAPIAITVFKRKRVKPNAASFSSLMVSASTLGLVPVVSNKAFNVYYTVYIQGKKVAGYTFELTSTEVNNFWSTNSITATKPKEQLFLEKTVSQLYHELSKNEELQANFEEYNLYFK